MAFVPLKLLPGVTTIKTALLAEAQWVSTNLVRFYEGLLQIIGGWSHIVANSVVGICRAIMPWQTVNGNQYIALGTEQRLEIANAGVLYDITPISNTSSALSSPFFATNASNIITVTDAGGYASVGEWINIATQASVDGLLLYGLYQIQTVPSGTTFTILASSNATSTTTGGTVPSFTTVNTSNSVAVVLANHGLIVGSTFNVNVSTTVGGITLFGPYIVATVTDSSHFSFTAGATASSSATVSENSGNVKIQYLLVNGNASSAPNTGYGSGLYGAGPYGIGIASGYSTIRQWSFAAWGDFLIANPTNGGIYVWQPGNGLTNNPAALIPQAPAYNAGLFLAMPEQQLVAYGSTGISSGTQDPLLVRWCDVSDYTDWIASSTNQAGSYRIPRGSRIVGGIQGPQQGLLWTDTSLWVMQYIQPPLVYGFNEVSIGCGLIAKRAICMVGNQVVWMGNNGFFLYQGGSVTPLVCPIWDTIYKNLNISQLDKITGAPNSSFNEAGFYLPSQNGNGENDTFVSINLNDGSWTYSNGTNAQNFIRTAWFDQSVIGPPVGVDLNGLVQQHETGTTADGSAIKASARTGWFKLAEGQKFISLERMIPDFVVLQGNPSLTITVYVVNYPGDAPTVYGPFPYVSGLTEYIITRARGRLASIQIDSSGIGGFWRLGNFLNKVYEMGRR